MSIRSIIQETFSDDISRYQCFNVPRSIERSYYFDLREKISSDLLAIPTVNSVYSMGSVGAPGVSDLDFLLVVDDCFKGKKELCHYFDSLNELDRYIAYVHLPYITFSSMVEDTQSILPLSNLELRGGVSHQFKTVTAGSELRSIFEDVLFLFYPTFFLTNLLNRRMDIRYSIQLLNSFRFPLEFVSKTDGFSDHIPYITKLDELKKNWQDLSLEDLKRAVLNLHFDALEIGYSLLDEVHKQGKGDPPLSTVQLPSFNTILSSNYSSKRALKTAVMIHERFKKFIRIMPMPLLKSYVTFFKNNQDVVTEVTISKLPVTLNSERQKRNQLFTHFSHLLNENEIADIVPFPYFFQSRRSSLLKRLLFKSVEFVL